VASDFHAVWRAFVYALGKNPLSNTQSPYLL
jgi:hypothetical protein